MATRRERVVLDLEDNFSGAMAKAAAATALLDKNLNGLDGSTIKGRDSIDKTSKSVDVLGVSMRRNSGDINQLSGRLRLMAEAAATLGPALIPIGGVGVAAVAGLASQASIAAIAGGSMLVAFQGVGDALKAVQEADLDPTVENLQKAREAMAAIGPDAAKFVTEFQKFRPVLLDIRDGAAAGWFPGLTESLTSFEALAPKVITLFEAIGKAGGDAIADSAESLASGRWTEFFDFLATEAPATITSLSKIVGDLAHGAAEMWMAFQPMNNSFTDWLMDVADGFDDWASSASGRDDIASFLDYVRETGPAVGQAFGSLVDALTQITQAAAPLGGPVLHIITAFAEALASIADSPIGTPLFTAIAAMSAFSRASKLMDAATLATSASLTKMGASATTASRSMGALRGAGQIAGGLLLIGAAVRSINDATRDALPGIDTMMRNLQQGAETDGASKLSRDFADLGESIERLYAKSNLEALGDNLLTPFEGIFGKTNDTQEALDEIAAIDAALAGLVDTEGPKVAAAALDDLYQSGLLTEEQLALLSANLPEYGNALDRAATATEKAASASGSLAAQERAAAAAIRAGVEALRAKTQAALGAFDAETQYRQALKDARKQANETNAGIRGSSEAAIANRGVISQLAAAWNNQSDAVKNNGAKFRESRSTFIDVATAMGVPIGQAKRLADSILDIPKARATKISAETAAAEKGIANLKRLLNGIDGTRYATYIDTYRTTISRQVGPAYNAGNPLKQADGGFVPKTGLPYADRHHFLLADGEGVTTNRHGETDRFRDVIGGINSGFSRSQIKGMLAEGGIVGRPNVGWQSGSGDNWSGVSAGVRAFGDDLRLAGVFLRNELRARQTLLEKEKEANRSRLDAIKAERDALMESVRARLTSNIADIDQIRSYASGSRADIAELEKYTNQRAQVVNQTAGVAAMTSGLTQQYREQLAVGRETNKKLGQVTTQLEAVKKELAAVKEAAGKTGPDRFADKLNNAAGAGHRRGRG